MDTGVLHRVRQQVDGDRTRRGARWVMFAVRMFVAAVVVIIVTGVAAGLYVVLSLH